MKFSSVVKSLFRTPTKTRPDQVVDVWRIEADLARLKNVLAYSDLYRSQLKDRLYRLRRELERQDLADCHYNGIELEVNALKRELASEEGAAIDLIALQSRRAERLEQLGGRVAA